MRAELVWQGGVAFRAVTGSGHAFLIDGPPEYGGENRGARPMETFLAGAAACSAFDVVHILGRARQPLAALTVEARGERASVDPKVFTRIHLHFVVAGAGDRAVERAVGLSVGKYCSALRMLAASCEISHSWACEG